MKTDVETNLFGDAIARDETSEERARRSNAERQRRFRRRHTQFFVPLIESPSGTTITGTLTSE